MLTKNFVQRFFNLFFILSTLAIYAVDVTVPLGGDIQDAIDEVNASGGGIVTLSAGTFNISSSLRIKSNVTLQGSGIYESTIATTSNIKMIRQSDDGLENIVIRNLTLTGTNQTNGGGMDIVSYGPDHDSITLSNVRCYNTGWGIHLKGATNVVVEDCDFSYNGAASKEGFAHNMYLRRVYGAVVRNSTFNNSTSANGINISYSTDIEIYDCEMIGNYFRGVRAADSDGFLVHNCIITDNGNIGLLANTENVVTKNIDWRNNCVANNDVGIDARNGATGTIVNCNAYGNGNDYNVTNSVSQSGNISDSSMECGSSTEPTGSCVDGFDANEMIEAEDFCAMDGIQTEASSEGTDNVGWINNGDWLAYSNIDLSGMQSINVRVATANEAGGTVEVRLGSPNGTMIGAVTVNTTGNFQAWETVSGSLSPTNSTEDIYLVFTGGDGYLFNINNFTFSEDQVLSTSVFNLVESTISIYPNPVSTRTTLKNAANATLTIYDLNGKKVFSQFISSESEKINLKNLQNGVYYGEVLKGGRNHVVKLIKN